MKLHFIYCLDIQKVFSYSQTNYNAKMIHLQKRCTLLCVIIFLVFPACSVSCKIVLHKCLLTYKFLLMLYTSQDQCRSMFRVILKFKYLTVCLDVTHIYIDCTCKWETPHRLCWGVGSYMLSYTKRGKMVHFNFLWNLMST